MPRDLRDYHARRDFGQTPEPRGLHEGQPLRRFVVHKHAARRLHYDLRLEWDGVLLSWAVTRGPSTDPAARRLAVRTEDHPVDYREFEGTIPAGQYGAGAMMVWDTGTWTPSQEVEQGLAEGKLKFVLAGERMRGGWMLVRMKPRAREKRENWLLIKERDSHAGSSAEALVRKHTTSVASGRSMEEIAKGRPARKAPPRNTARKQAARAGRGKRLRMPSFRAPQLAMLAEHAPAGDDWLHEIKFDGYRSIVAMAGGEVRLYSRSGLDWTEQFGVLVPDFQQLDCRSALIDGEVIAPGASEGAFSELQARLKHGGALHFMAFDLLELDGRNLAEQALLTRKEKLEKLLAGSALRVLRYSTHLQGHADQIMERVCAAGQEGIVSKLASAKYRSGRHSSWRKIKCVTRQEFVIGGWSPSSSRGRPLSSLLMGTFEDGQLRYRGRVGSGLGAREFETLVPRLADAASDACPFAAVPASMRKAHWLRPELVAEVKYAELTADGHIRHGVYQGLREDKQVAEIRMESAAHAGTGSSRRRGKEQATVSGVRISSGERLVYQSPRVTKLKVAQYYAEAAASMLPFAGNRPLSLVRCPDGTTGECFFQKHRGEGMPEAIGKVRIRESKGGSKEYICISDASGLVAAAQFGAIEFHLWGARADLLERPDRLVFDLDPDEGLGFGKVRKAALEMRVLLEELGLPSVPMLTGGKGVHVIVPLRRRADWRTVKLFAKTFATVVADHAPARYTATMAKSARKGRIFIDWLRNERGATAVAPYSLRARPGAKVAVPVTWKELASFRSAGAFDIRSVRKRLSLPCPLAEASERPVTLGKQAIRRLEKAWRTKAR